MKRLLNQTEKDFIATYFQDREDRRIISKIFTQTQDVEQAIDIFTNKTYYIQNSLIIIGK